MVGAPKLGTGYSWISPIVRRRTWAVAMSICLASVAGCVADFVNVPKASQQKPPPASRLAFVTQPGDVVAGTSLSGIQVVLQDSTGKTVTQGSAQVTLALSGGTRGANLRGSTAVTTADGMATFGGISVDSAGTNYRLTAHADGLPDATSEAFAVTAGPAVALAFIQQPTNVVALKKITPAVRIAATDSLGNATSSDVTVTVSLNGGNATLMGDPTQSTRSGAAVYSDLRVTRTGTFTLRASANGFGTIESQAFTVSESGDVIALNFTVAPSGASAGRIMSPAVRVAAVNDLGNTVPTATVPVTIGIMTGTGVAGAHLTGTLTVTTSGGEAAFPDLVIDSAGTGYKLVASSPGLTDAVTPGAFTVSAGAGARLVFTVQPADVVQNAAITPPPRVSVLDAAGNLVTGATAQVALYITAGTGTAGATLGGTTTVAVTNGVAEFSNVSVSLPGTGYQLTAAANGLASDVSTAFVVTSSGPPPAQRVALTPGSWTFAAVGATHQFTAQAFDNGNHVIAGAPMTYTTSNAAVATVDTTGLVTAVGNGAATIRATSGAVFDNSTVTVQQVTASVAITTSSDTITSLGAAVQLSAEARDANNNPIPGKTIAWSSQDPAIATIDATGNATAVSNGTATVRASVDGKSDTAPLVVRQAVATVAITPDTTTLTVGTPVTLQARAADARNNAVVRPLTFTWTSSDPAVTVTVDATDSSKATITRTAAGPAATITATAESKSGTATAN